MSSAVANIILYRIVNITDIHNFHPNDLVNENGLYGVLHWHTSDDDFKTNIRGTSGSAYSPCQCFVSDKWH